MTCIDLSVNNIIFAASFTTIKMEQLSAVGYDYVTVTQFQFEFFLVQKVPKLWRPHFLVMYI